MATVRPAVDGRVVRMAGRGRRPARRSVAHVGGGGRRVRADLLQGSAVMTSGEFGKRAGPSGGQRRVARTPGMDPFAAADHAAPRR